MYLYDDNLKKMPLYEKIYISIRDDILSNKLLAGEKLPSKRVLAEKLNVSIITVTTAYEQLIAEGYIYSIEKRGYFVNKIEIIKTESNNSCQEEIINPIEKQENILFDFSSNSLKKEYFPFSVWTKLIREKIKYDNEITLKKSPFNGIKELRNAISSYLYFNRGMNVSPEQIIIGSGAEYLYNIIIQLLGRDKIYGLENPGYKKISKIYNLNNINYKFIDLDENGLSLKNLNNSDCEIIHISPTHHFPTGITMPIIRRYELLNWANQKNGRFIIEDDYDSEFRFSGKPIQPLFNIDSNEKTIYINTFSKTISPTLRISYMILPKVLLEKYIQNLGFYSCSVSVFEQYVLSDFIGRGYFEKHLNRMKNIYRIQRDKLFNIIQNSKYTDKIEIIEQDSGLHFLIKIKSNKSESEIKEDLRNIGVNLDFLSEYYFNIVPEDIDKIAIINYSSIDIDSLQKANLF